MFYDLTRLAKVQPPTQLHQLMPEPEPMQGADLVNAFHTPVHIFLPSYWYSIQPWPDWPWLPSGAFWNILKKFWYLRLHDEIQRIEIQRIHGSTVYPPYRNPVLTRPTHGHVYWTQPYSSCPTQALVPQPFCLCPYMYQNSAEMKSYISSRLYPTSRPSVGYDWGWRG